MTGTSDGIDQLIEQPHVAELVTRYFAGDRDFAGHLFDEVGENPSGHFTEGDLLAVTFLDVSFGPSAARAPLDARRWKPLLQQDVLPAGVPLWHATDDHLAAANELWDQVTNLQQVGPTKASKLLARKRPQLLPIYDSVVGDFLAPRPGEFWNELRDSLSDDSRRAKVDAWTIHMKRQVATLRAIDAAVWMRCARNSNAVKARESVGLPAEPLARR